MTKFSEQELIRREKLKALRSLGIDPYPAALFPIDADSKSIRENFCEGKKVIIAGRLMSRRIQGKASFAELQDSKGRIQLYFNRDEICEGEDKILYNELYKRLLDIGDIIGLEGTLFTTQVGEKTIMVKSFQILNKTLRPLPLPKADSDGNIYDEINQVGVPESAVTIQGSTAFVYTVRDETAEKKNIEIGKRNFGKVSVVSGINEGDLVITEGVSKVRNNAKIKIINPRN